jgi:hypothetical protein
MNGCGAHVGEEYPRMFWPSMVPGQKGPNDMLVAEWTDSNLQRTKERGNAADGKVAYTRDLQR